jgi:hypothetical protein
MDIRLCGMHHYLYEASRKYILGHRNAASLSGDHVSSRSPYYTLRSTYYTRTTYSTKHHTASVVTVTVVANILTASLAQSPIIVI